MWTWEELRVKMLEGENRRVDDAIILIQIKILRGKERNLSTSSPESLNLTVTCFQ